MAAPPDDANLSPEINGVADSLKTLALHDQHSASTQAIVDALKKFEAHLDSLFFRLDALSSRLDSLSFRLDALSSRLDSVPYRLDSQSSRLNLLFSRLDSLEEQMNNYADARKVCAHR
jgi:division protein CdvB (Snf7/Vps24/ESCRT-III family)